MECDGGCVEKIEHKDCSNSSLPLKATTATSQGAELWEKQSGEYAVQGSKPLVKGLTPKDICKFREESSCMQGQPTLRHMPASINHGPRRG